MFFPKIRKERKNEKIRSFDFLFLIMDGGKNKVKQIIKTG